MKMNPLGKRFSQSNKITRTDFLSTCSCGSILLECRLQLCQIHQVCVWPDPIINRNYNFLLLSSFWVHNLWKFIIKYQNIGIDTAWKIHLEVGTYLCRNWNDFFFEFTRCCCSCSTLVRVDLIIKIKRVPLNLIISLKFLSILNFSILTAAWSCSCLVTPYRCATFSEVIPMGSRQSRACAKVSTC